MHSIHAASYVISYSNANIVYVLQQQLPKTENIATY